MRWKHLSLLDSKLSEAGALFHPTEFLIPDTVPGTYQDLLGNIKQLFSNEVE